MFVRLLAWAVLVVLAARTSARETQDGGAPPSPGAQSGVDFGRERTLLEEATAALTSADAASARDKARETVDLLLARPGGDRDATWLDLLNRAGLAAWDARDMPVARLAWEKVLEVRSASLSDDHPDLQWSRLNLAATIKLLDDLQGARALEEKVVEIRSRTLPDDHPDLQTARLCCADSAHQLGDFKAARELREAVLEARSRSLPDDHRDLQKVRLSLSNSMQALGDFKGARALREKVVEVYSRTVPDEHPDLQAARASLANSLRDSGDLKGARALQEKVLEVRSRTLPDDHPDLQALRGNLAITLQQLGDLQGALALQENILEIRTRTLPDDHPDLQTTRANVAILVKKLDDPSRALALEQKVLEIRSRTLPDEHPYVQSARFNLAATLEILGDFQTARSLLERVLEVRSRTLPDDHPQLQLARQGLAGALHDLGDMRAARALFEKVLEVRSRSLPDDHPDLQTARQNLAVTAGGLGDHAGARALLEKVLEVRERTLPDDHRDLQSTRQSLSTALYSLGDLEAARALDERVLEVRARTLPDDHPDVVRSQQCLAVTLYALGDLSGAREIQERVLEVFSRTFPEGHRSRLVAQGNLAATIAAASAGASEGEKEEGRKQCVELVLAYCRAQVRSARAALTDSSPREATVRCQKLTKGLDYALSFVVGAGVFPPSPELEVPAFELSETTRGAALGSAALMRLAAGSPRYTELRLELQSRSEELARLAEEGMTSSEFQEALARREAAERELVALAQELSGGRWPGLHLDVDALARALAEDEAVVTYRRYDRWDQRPKPLEGSNSRTRPSRTPVPSLCAFVLRGSGRSPDPAASRGRVASVDLGPIEPIADAVRVWREGLGAAAGRGLGAEARPSAASFAERGHALRRLLLDPLAGELAGASRCVIVPDDVVHLVPFDALPRSGDSGDLVGDHLRIETRATLTELLVAPSPFEEGGRLLAVGDVDFDSAADGRQGRPLGSSTSSEILAASSSASAGLEKSGSGVDPRELPFILRGGGFGGFAPLPATGSEVEALTESFAETVGSTQDASILRGADATRGRWIELAPRARWLHVATHGWFAPESVRSWKDDEPLDSHSGLGMRLSGEEQVKGMSPMLLCGLALAGANLPEDGAGRAPGLITADEIASLDLAGCELAVLSACDTNVGERRAGQGVASLQQALQMAGARSVITSLWKVPDGPTRDLMVDFYRRMWVEKKPKWQALWEAKKRLRDARDERGQPRYTTRDWAAWVITGDPR